jgi:glycerol kinase
MPVILGIDQGTTSTKAFRAVAGEAAQLVGRHVHRQIHPRAGWVEHDPEEILAGVRDLIAQAGPVDAIGLANQGETCLAWDAQTGRPFHNAIVWQDDRTRADIERLRAAGLEAVTTTRAGLPLDPYFSAAKLRWLLDNGDGASAAHHAGRLRLGTLDAFLIERLTGRFITDVTTASRTSLLNLATLCWDPELCAAFGVPMECLPTILPSGGAFGDVRGVRLCAAMVDQQAALFGHGCSEPGDLKITFGTGAFALALAGQTPPLPVPGLISTCAWQVEGQPAHYAVEAGLFTAGAAIEWLDRIGLRDDLAAADAPSAAERGVMFVPALAGLACPYWDRSARALWIGMDLATTREDLGQAVLEGVALRAAQMLPALAQAAGGRGMVRVDGGLTRNAYFTSFLARALGREIAVADTADVTALGIIRLAMQAMGAPGAPTVDHRTVTPAGTLPESVHARFASAVERARDWAPG